MVAHIDPYVFTTTCALCDLSPPKIDSSLPCFHGKMTVASPWGCEFIIPGYILPGMKEYFASTAWKTIVLVDTMLHRAANKGLELTIKQLGNARFQAAVDPF